METPTQFKHTLCEYKVSRPWRNSCVNSTPTSPELVRASPAFSILYYTWEIELCFQWLQYLTCSLLLVIVTFYIHLTQSIDLSLASLWPFVTCACLLLLTIDTYHWNLILSTVTDNCHFFTCHCCLLSLPFTLAFCPYWSLSPFVLTCHSRLLLSPVISICHFQLFHLKMLPLSCHFYIYCQLSM